MDRHNQTHNDIKPQNFLVKFNNGPNDLTKIEIALTDFGMAGPESQGGTPIFASPECFEKKEKKSDIFSFGRVILFLLLSKERFVKWLFIPVKDQTRALHRMVSLCRPEQTFNLISQMTSLSNRIGLHEARKLFERLKKRSRISFNRALINTIDIVINDEITNDNAVYVAELCDFR